jgi:hypothetical protein
MADEDDKAASVKGRTVWDIVVLIISNKSLMTLLVIMFIAALPLSYFGLLSIQYDNGLRIRFGPDPVLRDRDEKKDNKKKMHKPFEPPTIHCFRRQKVRGAHRFHMMITPRQTNMHPV